MKTTCNSQNPQRPALRCNKHAGHKTVCALKADNGLVIVWWVAK